RRVLFRSASGPRPVRRTGRSSPRAGSWARTWSATGGPARSGRTSVTRPSSTCRPSRRCRRAAWSPTSSPRWPASTRSWGVWTDDVRPGGPGAAGARRQADHQPLSAAEVGAAPAPAPRPVRGRARHAGRHRALRGAARHHARAGDGRRDVLHPRQAEAGRRVPRRRLHQHPVRHHGRRPDLGRAERAHGARQRRDHPGRQGQHRADRVQRGLRLRPGDDGQLGVLRQHDSREGQEARRRPARGAAGAAHPRSRAPRHVAGGGPHPRGLPRRPRRRGRAGRAGVAARAGAGARAGLGGAARRRRPRAARRAGAARADLAAAARAGRADPRGGQARQPGGTEQVTTLTPVLTRNWDQADSFTREGYERGGGYRALRKAFRMEPDEIVQAVKDSGLRGRGGAGFPTGMKWGFLPPDSPNPRYLVVNADESEPGTCKDIPLMMANPHVLVEGTIISSYAIKSNLAFIYVRGEVLHVIRRLYQAVAEAYEAGYLGKDIVGSGYDLDIVVHTGAGAYICGEETALLDSLEGFRGWPRLKPPFPAVAGLYG